MPGIDKRGRMRCWVGDDYKTREEAQQLADEKTVTYEAQFGVCRYVFKPVRHYQQGYGWFWRVSRIDK